MTIKVIPFRIRGNDHRGNCFDVKLKYYVLVLVTSYYASFISH